MNPPIYYVETSVPSFYFDTRRERKFQAMREWTREWWDLAGRRRDHLVTSAATFDELELAPQPKAGSALNLIAKLPVFDFDRRIQEIIGVYLVNHVMPADAGGDAAHLAFASFHQCSYLVTWNCKHLANARKFDHIDAVNLRLGLPTPRLVTPQQLLENNDEHDA